MELDICSSTSLDADSPQTDVTRTSTILKTPEQSQTPAYTYRQNHVTSVLLHGVPIVSLHIDGKERLCLAQISNTLLKRFSYNEIHNRRVALGITCVQCTPVQLEILRRAGAMPISSRRCGMITKREAERLVKSFLEDNRPPKLPDNFYFEVVHNCGWGCKGKFEPSRYNSSRAKCIRCNFCNLYFSPNKFIFHFHRVPESKYSHPDAANFNSWRRHLNLTKGSENDDMHHAWEDVKAMFNGGSRKRMLSSPGFPESQTTSPEEKRQKPSVDEGILSKPVFGNQYQSYPLFTMPGKTYPFSALNTPNPLALQYQINKNEIRNEGKQTQSLAFHPWRQPTDYIIPPYDLFWTNQFTARPGGLTGFGKNYFNSSPVKDLTARGSDRQSPSDTHTSSEDEESVSFSPHSENLKSNSHSSRPSAFRPVGKASRTDKLEKSLDETNEDIIETNIGNTNSEDDLEDSDIDIEEECGYVDSNENCKIEIVENRLYSPDTSGSNNNDSTNCHETDAHEHAHEHTEEVKHVHGKLCEVTDIKQVSVSVVYILIMLPISRCMIFVLFISHSALMRLI